MGETSRSDATADEPSLGDFFDRHWARTPACYVSFGLLAIGIAYALVGIGLFAFVNVARGVTAVSIGSLFTVAGFVGWLFECRLSNNQHRYLDRLERKEDILQGYKQMIDDDAAVPPNDERYPFSKKELQSRLDIAIRELDEARDSVYRGDYVGFMTQLYEADRETVYAQCVLDTAGVPLDGPQPTTWSLDFTVSTGTDGVHTSGRVPTGDSAGSRMHHFAERLCTLAASLPDERRTLIEEYLKDDEGTVKSSPTAEEVYQALRVGQEWDIGQLEVRFNVRRYMRLTVELLFAILLGIAGVFVLAGGSGLFGEILGIPEANSVLVEEGFLALVFLVGCLGATFSTLFPVRARFFTQTVSDAYDSKIPHPSFVLEALVALALIGGISAVLMFLILFSELATAVFNERTLATLKTPMVVVILAFVSGFSERFVRRSIERVIGKAEKEAEKK